MACLQADLINMAYNINPITVEDYITRRWLIVMSRAVLNAFQEKMVKIILKVKQLKCWIIS